MELKRETNLAMYQIRSYTSTSITVNEQVFTNSLLIMPDYVSTWQPRSIAEISEDNILELTALKPSVILLGTSAKLQPPTNSTALVAACNAQGIGLEIMATPAACRTYTILANEGRRVLAALIL